MKSSVFETSKYTCVCYLSSCSVLDSRQLLNENEGVASWRRLDSLARFYSAVTCLGFLRAWNQEPEPAQIQLISEDVEAVRIIQYYKSTHPNPNDSTSTCHTLILLVSDTDTCMSSLSGGTRSVGVNKKKG
jgi:hypothetical protein